MEFLGNYAGKERDEDAIFSTSLALNALLDAWTTRRGKSVTFDDDVPNKVKESITRGINYLLENIKYIFNDLGQG